MGIDDKVLGELTKKFGISADQAKAALDKIIPFAKGKLGALGSLGGAKVGLLSKIPDTDLLHHHEVEEVAQHSGLSTDKVKEMLPDIAKMLDR